MKIGYARVSKNEQDTQLQIDALTAAGCERIYEEKQSGAKEDRAELEHCLMSLREGDVLIVWKLDRLGRSMHHLINLIVDLEKRQVGFQSLTQNIDTTSPSGVLIFQVFCALAEFERAQLRERVIAGLAAAKKKGRKGGRPPALSEKDKKIALTMLNSGDYLKIDIARHLKISRQTFYNFLKDINHDE